MGLDAVTPLFRADVLEGNEAAVRIKVSICPLLKSARVRMDDGLAGCPQPTVRASAERSRR